MQNQEWGLSAYRINRTFLEKFSIHKYSNSIRFEFVKKTSKSNPVEWLILRATTRMVPDLSKALANLSETIIRRFAVDIEDLKNHTEN